MWDKPREITGTYKAAGFEIAHSYGTRVTPESALSNWKQSKAHNAIILNLGAWSATPWRAMGVAISDRFALVWFGELEDPAGTP